MILKTFIFLALISVIAAQKESRIVGGKPAKIDEHPWQVSVQVLGEHVCGGALVAPNLVLTGAYCIMNPNDVSNLMVRAGSQMWKSGGVTTGVKSAKIHPNYNASIFDANIAILELATNLTASKTIQKIGIPSKNLTLPEDQLVVVSGWGKTNPKSNAPYPNRLAAVQLELVDQHVCQAVYGEKIITPRMFCASPPAGQRNKGACFGDSGGPVTFGKYLFGLVSHGDGCGTKKDFPDIFSRVAELIDDKFQFITQPPPPPPA